MNSAGIKISARKALAEILLRTGLVPAGKKSIFSQQAPAWRILMYHRVIDRAKLSYPVEPGMYVDPETFRIHMKELAENYSVISLNELVSRLSEQKPVDSSAVVITFDDGWSDNFDFAFPILK